MIAPNLTAAAATHSPAAAPNPQALAAGAVPSKMRFLRSLGRGAGNSGAASSRLSQPLTSQFSIESVPSFDAASLKAMSEAMMSFRAVTAAAGAAGAAAAATGMGSVTSSPQHRQAVRASSDVTVSERMEQRVMQLQQLVSACPNVRYGHWAL